ncbi:MAG: D-2-hydroxyacid dehydrogenase, partial [Campylobacteraceae bacterium]|nr:D-2-hydroxyacid dehydrogenase [Campylobacteraceae bacterium]
IVITNKVVINSEIMDKSSIKLICVAATGTNNIDLKYAASKKIEVKNVTDYSTSSVSQLTFSIVLKFMQKLEYYENYTREGEWEKSEIFTNLDVPFHELADKTWGIIGLGGIGQKVAKIAESFGCRVNYYSTSGKNFNTDYIQVGFDELLSTSDIISIHCPLNDDTLNLISLDDLLIMKDKAILLNLGRGGIINEEDLAKVIDMKEIYCGIDVVSKEPIDENSPLRKIKNTQRLILTPHIGWASIEARNRLIEGVITNIKEHVL